MGGRREREGLEWADREVWITEVSDDRLARYERMLESAGAERRTDGTARGDKGRYFRELIGRERARRASSLF